MGRTGGGVFNVTARVGHQRLSRQRLLSDAAGLGPVGELLQRGRRRDARRRSGLADAYYRLYGGGVGGPIVKNRTFFWAATEGYRSGTTRGQQEIWPTANQRNGDFSRTTVGRRAGRALQPVVPRRRRQRAGVRRPAPARLRPAACSPARSSRCTHPAVSQTGLNILKHVADRDDQRPDAAERGRQHQRERHGVHRRHRRRCARSRRSTSSPTSRR